MNNCQPRQAAGLRPLFQSDTSTTVSKADDAPPAPVAPTMTVSSSTVAQPSLGVVKVTAIACKEWYIAWAVFHILLDLQTTDRDVPTEQAALPTQQQTQSMHNVTATAGERTAAVERKKMLQQDLESVKSKVSAHIQEGSKVRSS